MAEMQASTTPRSSRLSSSPLLDLPAELIDHILSFVSPLDLVAVSWTCNLLHEHCLSDGLWAPHVAANLPHPLSSAKPYSSFRALYTAHHPYWFLTRHQLWFADTPHTGKLLLARYSPSRACIEAYSLNAERGAHTFQFWEHDREVIIHTFHPSVSLDYNAPILKLDASAYFRSELLRTQAASDGHGGTREGGMPSKLQLEIPMNTYPSNRVASSGAQLYSQFMLTRPCPNHIISRGTAVWPPLVVPTPGAKSRGERTRNESVQLYRGISHKPETLDEMSTTSWRLRRWMEFTSRANGEGMVMHMQRNEVGDMIPVARASPFGPGIDTRVSIGMGLHPAASVGRNGGINLRVGEDVTTFATLDMAAYTPTKRKPWRGIWVGDYSGHGCEFMAVLQPDEEEVRSGRRPLPLCAAQLLSEMEERDRWRNDAQNGGFTLNPSGNLEEVEEALAAHLTSTHENDGVADDHVLASDSAYHIGFATPHMTDDEDEEGPTLVEILTAPQHDDNPVRLTNQEESSSDEDVYSGRIEAIKLTGDPNIPRGEYTFIAPDIGPGGLVRVATEEMFRGARVVRSVGHIAARGFREGKFFFAVLGFQQRKVLISYEQMGTLPAS